MGTLVGWKSRPTVITTLVYFLYWTVVGMIFVWQKIKSHKKIPESFEKDVKAIHNDDILTVSKETIVEPQSTLQRNGSGSFSSDTFSFEDDLGRNDSKRVGYMK